MMSLILIRNGDYHTTEDSHTRAANSTPNLSSTSERKLALSWKLFLSLDSRVSEQFSFRYFFGIFHWEVTSTFCFSELFFSKHRAQLCVCVAWYTSDVVGDDDSFGEFSYRFSLWNAPAVNCGRGWREKSRNQVIKYTFIIRLNMFTTHTPTTQRESPWHLILISLFL